MKVICIRSYNLIKINDILIYEEYINTVVKDFMNVIILKKVNLVNILYLWKNLG